MNPPALHIEDLFVTFPGEGGDVPAVRGITLDAFPGETVAVVGESGSGKSAAILAAMGLHPPQARIRSASLSVGGIDVGSQDPRQLRAMRGAVAGMVFQDPLTSLNPFLTIGAQVSEGLRGRRQARGPQMVAERLREVGLPEPERIARCYPHQLSGGMRQRALIAIALAGDPRVLFADEPTTALDVTVQAQILELFRRLVQDRKLCLVIVTHDLGVVAEVADRVVVFYAGRVVEEARATDLFRHPQHPYTQGLLRSVRGMASTAPGDHLPQIEGAPPDPRQRPPGCPFHPRCDRATTACQNDEPPLAEDHAGHLSACWLPGAPR